MKAEYEALKTRIQLLDRSYFQDHRNLVSDQTYDQLRKKLEQMEKEHPEWVTVDSPTQKLSDDRQAGFSQLDHVQPMLSLDKLMMVEELLQWMQQHPKESYVLEPKVDGMAVDLDYQAGRLVHAVTRGNGTTGDDVTWQMGGVLGVPQQLKETVSLHVRGEIFMLRSVFKQVNANRQAAGFPLLANCRNAAAGAVKSLDGAALRERQLRFLPYRVVQPGPDTTLPFWEQALLKRLQLLGFGLLPMIQEIPRDITVLELDDLLLKFNLERQHLDFDTDGAVIKINNLLTRYQLGDSNRLHRGAVAFKFAANEAETQLKGVTFQVGRTGAITPVAELEPVQLDGSVVSRASLHNQDNLNRLGLHVGDIVTVRKAGEIIPELVEVVEQSKTGHPVSFPVSCPCCRTPLVKRQNESGDESSAWYCAGTECRDKTKAQILHWCRKEAMNIEAIGPETVGDLVDRLQVKTVADLYTVTEAQLVMLPGFGEGRIQNWLKEIENSKQQGMARVLAALGIPKLGRTYADKLARHYPDLWTMLAQWDRTKNLPDLGDVVSRNVDQWMTANVVLLTLLNTVGVSFASKDYTLPGERRKDLEGWVVVFTGTMSIDRDRASARVVELGGRVAGSVSGKTTHLVAGLDCGSKLTKATQLGVKILDETQFKEITHWEG